MTIAGTSTMLTSSSASAVYGQSVTFTATVAGPATATDGHVLHRAGHTGRSIGTGMLSVDQRHDVATFTTSTLPVSGSPYAITAVYGGDADNLGSTSNFVNQTITKATRDRSSVTPYQRRRPTATRTPPPERRRAWSRRTRRTSSAC